MMNAIADGKKGLGVLLLTLPPSHFCERARWALDHRAFDYEEERLAPGSHILRVRRLGASTTSLPLLLFADGSICQGSDRILDWTEMLGGDAEIERRFEQRTAPLIRRCLYAGLLSDPKSGIRDVLLRVSSRRQSAIGRLTWPLMRQLMVSGMNARLDVLPDLITRVDRELDWFDQVLHERGDYLSEYDFGRADLTAASLLAPIAELQTEPIRSISEGISWPASLAPTLKRWSDRPAVRWVQRTYAIHRATSIDQHRLQIPTLGKRRLFAD